jgi:hypothetical protein
VAIRRLLYQREDVYDKVIVWKNSLPIKFLHFNAAMNFPVGMHRTSSRTLFRAILLSY